MEKVDIDRWNITVFSQGDKVASHLIHSEDEKHAMIEHFKSNVVSFNAVEKALAAWRKT